MRIRTTLLLIFLINLFRCSSPSTPVVPPPKGAIKKIVYGGDKDYYPYESLNEEGYPSGFHVELIQAIGKVLGAEVEIQLLPWAEVKRQIRDHKLDVACFFYTPERDQYLDFTFHHNVIYHNLVTREGELEEITLDSLTKHTVIVQQESGAAEYLLKNYPHNNIVFADSEPDALQLLSSGQYDCALVSQYQVHHFINNFGNQNLVPRGAPLLPFELGFVVTEGRDELLDQINQAVSYLQATGEYSKIYLKFFGVTKQDVLMQILQVVLWLLVPLFLILGLSLAWSRSLQYKVKEKTRQIQDELRERQIAEKKLRESDAYLKEAQRLASLGNWTYDFATGKIEFSDEQHRIMEVPSYERPQKLNELMEMVHPEDRSGIRKMIDQTPEAPGIYNVEFRLCMNGKTKHLFLSGYPHYDQDGKIIGMHGTVMDITRRKQDEIKLKEQNRTLEQINKDLDNFVYSSSHDMRALLASTLGLIQIMRNEPPQSWTHDYLSLVERNTLRLEEFTEEITSYATDRKFSVTVEQVDMSPLIAEAFDQHRYLNPQVSIKLITETHQNGIIFSDARRLRVILNNLISNAIKYHNPYRTDCYIRVEVLHQERHVLIRVEDNGQGIPPQRLSRIFEMFVQVDDKLNRSGLGLYIVRESALKLNGTVEVESKLDEGTTFTITLPH